MALPTTTLFDYPTVEALGYYIAASRVGTTCVVCSPSTPATTTRCDDVATW